MPFDELLSDYLDKRLEKKLAQLGIAKIEIHIDWHEDHKCIGIQGKYQNSFLHYLSDMPVYYLDIQIYPEEYSFAADTDEPDDDNWEALTGVQAFYLDLETKLLQLAQRA